MLYPGNAPFLGRAPFIMHYGSDYTLGDKKAYFNKMSHQQLRLETCPNFLFDEPWDGTVLAHATQLSKQDRAHTMHIPCTYHAYSSYHAWTNPTAEQAGCALDRALRHAQRCLLPVLCAHRLQPAPRTLWRQHGFGIRCAARALVPPPLHWAASLERGAGGGCVWFGVARLGGVIRVPPTFGLASIQQEAHIDAVQPTIAHCRQWSCRRTAPSSPTRPRRNASCAAAAGLPCLPCPGHAAACRILYDHSTQVTRRKCAQAGRGWVSAARTHSSCIAVCAQSGSLLPGASGVRHAPGLGPHLALPPPPNGYATPRKGTCAVTCKSCLTPVDEVLSSTDQRYAGDWKHLRNLKTGKQKQEALAYIASAEEPELHELDDAMEERRAFLTQKIEL